MMADPSALVCAIVERSKRLVLDNHVIAKQSGHHPERLGQARVPRRAHPRPRDGDAGAERSRSRTIPAADGRQALEYLRLTGGSVEAPALMILDLMMPIMSGWQVLDELEAEPALQLPVIVVSASGSPPPESSATVFLHKPFNLEELLDTIHQRC